MSLNAYCNPLLRMSLASLTEQLMSSKRRSSCLAALDTTRRPPARHHHTSTQLAPTCGGVCAGLHSWHVCILAIRQTDASPPAVCCAPVGYLGKGGTQLSMKRQKNTKHTFCLQQNFKAQLNTDCQYHIDVSLQFLLST